MDGLTWFKHCAHLDVLFGIKRKIRNKGLFVSVIADSLEYDLLVVKQIFEMIFFYDAVL